MTMEGRQRRTFWLGMKSTIRILFLEMMTVPHTDYNVKRTFDDVMMICKIYEDNHTNGHHHCNVAPLSSAAEQMKYTIPT